MNDAQPIMRRLHADIDSLAAPLALFSALYLAALIGIGALAGFAGPGYGQCVALGSVAIATLVTIAICEKGRWPLGLTARPLGRPLLELAGGALFAMLLLALVDALIEISTGLRHARGGGFPWLELATVLVPAALHEELLFRGYPFQKLLARHRRAAYAAMALVFAALHGWNRGITMLALLNLVLAGAMLGLAYELRRSLWIPIGLHLAWNVVSGPILGYPISGYIASSSLLAVRSPGAEALSGGAFGIEGSVWATIVELAAILALERRLGSVSAGANRA